MPRVRLQSGYHSSYSICSVLNKRGTGMTYHCKGSNKGLFGGTAKTLLTAARHLIDALKVILTEKDIPDSASGFFGILWYFIEDKLHFWNYWYYCSIIVFVLFVVCHSRISSVSRGLDCSRAGGRGFDSQSRAITNWEMKVLPLHCKRLDLRVRLRWPR